MSDKRRKPRKRPEKLVYVEIEPGNGGIMLNASEDGFSFQAVSPVAGPGPIRFRFSIDPHRKVEGVGELAWSDGSRKVGGLRFTGVSAESRQMIRSWLGETAAAVNAGKNPQLAAAVPVETLAEQRRREKSQRTAEAPPQPEKRPGRTPAPPSPPEMRPPEPPAAVRVAEPPLRQTAPSPAEQPPVAPKPQPPAQTHLSAPVPAHSSEHSPPVLAPAAVRAPEPSSPNASAAPRVPVPPSPPHPPSAPAQAPHPPASAPDRSMLRLDLRSVHPEAETHPQPSVVPSASAESRPGVAPPQNFSAGSAMLTPRERRAKLREEALRAANPSPVNRVAEAPPEAQPAAPAVPQPQIPAQPSGHQPSAHVAPQVAHSHPVPESPLREFTPHPPSAPSHDPLHRPHEEVRLIPPPATETVSATEIAATAPSRFTLRRAVTAMLIIMAFTAFLAYRRAVGEALIWLGQKIAGTPASSFVPAPHSDLDSPPGVVSAGPHAVGEALPSGTQPSSHPPDDFSSNPIPLEAAPSVARPEPSSAGNTPSPLPATQRQYVPAPRDGTDATGADSQALWQEVERGNPAAELALAHLYLSGQGVARNCEQARILLDAAARKGNTEARQQLTALDQHGCPQ